MKRIHAALSVVILAVFMCPLPASHAEPDLNIQQIQQQLKPLNPFRSSFHEQRFIAALTAPLESEGEMQCLPERGILWRVTRPVERTTIITPDGLKIISRTGESESVADRAKISAALLSLMGGAVEKASEDFTITASGNVKAWSITLTPKDSLVAEIVAKIVVQGSDRPQVLEVHHANSDRIVTTFTEPTILSEGELRELQSSLNAAL
jgi:hypothetical protein